MQVTGAAGGFVGSNTRERSRRRSRNMGSRTMNLVNRSVASRGRCIRGILGETGSASLEGTDGRGFTEWWMTRLWDWDCQHG